MSKFTLKFRGKVFREFVSFRQMTVWAIDVIQRVGFILLLILAGVLPELLEISNQDLAVFVSIYSLAVLLWGLLLLKYVLGGKHVFEKTKFDFFLMGLMSLFLLVVLFSENRVEGVFGTSGTYSYSVITLLAVSIIYYVGVLVFKYIRGVKWLSLGFLLSLFVSSLYQIVLIIKDEGIIDRNYLLYSVLALPLSIGLAFLFRKIMLKALALISVVLNLFLIAYYSDYLNGAMFVLSTGVLALFLLFYFSFWIKNSKKIADYFKGLFSKVRDIRQLVNYVKKNKRDSFVILIVFFMALWILGFALFSFDYFSNDLWPYLKDGYRGDFDKLQGVRFWLTGENDLTQTFSSIEFMNILGNYGIFTVAVYLAFLAFSIFKTGKLVLSMLYNGSFKNVILLSGIFVSFFCVFVIFLISRFNPLIYILFLVSLVLLSVVESLMKKEGAYFLPEINEGMSTGSKIVRSILSLLILALTALGVIGLNAGVDEGLF